MVLRAFGGRYVPLELIGRGGMGTVFRCYDRELGREVAVKCARLGTMEQDGRRRLVHEARALAALSSAHVVRVYDVSVDAATIAIAMEYVAGQSLRRWLAERKRTQSEIMGVFEQVVSGLADVHAKGLVHGDIKPDNVLLGTDGRVCLADFGLATSSQRVHAIEPDVARDDRGDPRGASVTRSGLMIGTLGYMAPEQHRARRADAQSDQYALCVALWEALTGSLPFSTPQPDATGLLRQKLLGPPSFLAEEPSPSLSPAVVRALRRGLAPSPDRRWPSVRAFWDAALGRRRRRWPVWAGTAIAIVFVGWGTSELVRSMPAAQCDERGSLDGIWGAQQQARISEAIGKAEREDAPRLIRAATESLDAYADRWSASWSRACGELGLRAPTLHEEQHLRCLESARSSLRASVLALSTSRPQDVARIGEVLDRLPDLARCAGDDVLERVPPPGLRPAVDRANRLLDEAVAVGALGRYEEMRERVEALEARIEAIGYEPLRDRWLLLRGIAERNRGELNSAMTRLQQAYVGALEGGRFELAANAAYRLAVLLGEALERQDEGLAYSLSALGLARGAPELEAAAYRARSQIFYGEGRYAEAEAEARLALRSHQDVGPELATTHNAIANALAAQGDTTRSEAHYRKAAALLDAAYGPYHPHSAATWASVAGILQARGEYARAETLFRDALTVLEQAHGRSHRSIAGLLNNLGNTLDAQGRHEEAEEKFRRALEILQTTIGEPGRHEALVRSNLGACLFGRERYAEAQSELRASVELTTQILGPDHPLVGSGKLNLGETLAKLGRIDEARVEVRAALSIFERRLGPDHPRVARALVALAELHTTQSGWSSVARLLRRADAIFDASTTAPHERAATRFALAKALARNPRERVAALETGASAGALLDGVEGSSELRREIVRWLGMRGVARPDARIR